MVTLLVIIDVIIEDKVQSAKKMEARIFFWQTPGPEVKWCSLISFHDNKQTNIPWRTTFISLIIKFREK